MALLRLLISLALAFSASGQKIVLTNDDGWAVAIVRAQNDALKTAGYDVVLSCPAINKSGTGSSTTTPTVLTSPCEFNTCPTGSPAEGFNASDTRLNYVNAFPVDAARFGIQTLAPKFFRSKPDLVVSGPNVGNNLGSTVLVSGTVGAASEAALEGIPAVAFSAATGDQVSYTTLTTAPTSAGSKAALIYSQLSVTLLKTLLASSGPILPAGIALNVNYPSTSSCTSAAAFKFVLTRINSNSGATDVQTCGTTHLPTESSVVAKSGCFASVSVFNASTKGDVNPATQAVVLAKLSSLLTCSNQTSRTIK
ncbi:sure-like protein [Mycena belliarum]|uniref:Sure-like protein n=1 Tax=Mycena belliarum TaxID=1033014 RepID=A0AAD6TUI4_9AGAR|nr:sure-like protein [Mycena belliae]